MSDSAGVRLGTPAGRWVLLACVLGSGMASLDATVVNVALPRIGQDLSAGLTGLQWTVNAYTLTLAGFLLLGGSLGDHRGRRAVFVVGVVWFAVASALCAAAPNAGVLIAARALQGVGGALMVPGSLAIIEASYVEADRSAAVGAWSGLGGVTTAIGPALGGFLIGAASWRYIFLLNLPLAVAVIVVAVRHVPESRDDTATGRLDFTGAALAPVALGGVTYALTEGPALGWGDPAVVTGLAAGVFAAVAFAVTERRSDHPMLPLSIFGSRQFSAANAVTLLVYAAISGALFLLPIELQRVVRYSPLAAGTALLPVTIAMLLLSARVGRLAGRIGPRPLMTAGPLVAAVGLAVLSRVGAGSAYLADVLPGVLIFGLGLALTVAPLTSSVLAAAGPDRAGIASAVNNDVARAAGLLAVGVLPAVAGLTGPRAASAEVFAAGYPTGLLVAAGLCAAGGLVALALVRRLDVPAPAAAEAEGRPRARASEPLSHCGLDGPPLRHSR